MDTSSPEPAGGPELPNLRHLRLLDATVTLRSVSRAAEAVHMSQPAASQALARLARIFAAQLVERAGSGVAATPEGEIVQRRGRRALEHLAEAGRRLAPRSRLGRGMVGEALERQVSMAQLRALAAFAEAQSFSGAARRLNQTEPTIQRAAREIERLVGVPLFEGTHRALRLTAAGEVLAMKAGLVLKEIETAHAELREARGRFDGHLVIGTLPLGRTRIVPEAVVALMARHPEATVEIIDGPYDSLAHQLRIGACDMIIGALRSAARPPGIAETPLFDDALCIVARAGHPLAGRRATAADLAAHPWVLPRRGTPSRAIFDRLQAEHGLLPPGRGHVETGSLVALRGVLQASDALSIISRRQIETERRHGLLVEIDFPLPDAHRPIGVATLEGWQPTALQARFLDLLRDQIRGEGA